MDAASSRCSADQFVFRNDYMKELDDNALCHCNAVMIAVQSDVYGYLTSQVAAASPIVEDPVEQH